MATCIEINAVGYNYGAQFIPVVEGCLASTMITPSGANQVTAFTATQVPADARLLVCSVTADENVAIVIAAPDPVSGLGPLATTTGQRYHLAAGTTRDFKFTAGQQVAVVTR